MSASKLDAKRRRYTFMTKPTADRHAIDIQGRTSMDSMYDLVAGPKPADMVANPVPDENLQDAGAPGVVLCTWTILGFWKFSAHFGQLAACATSKA